MVKYNLPSTITKADLADACRYTKLSFHAMAARPAVAEHLVAMHQAIQTQMKAAAAKGDSLSVEAENALIARMQNMHANEIFDQLV